MCLVGCLRSRRMAWPRAGGVTLGPVEGAPSAEHAIHWSPILVAEPTLEEFVLRVSKRPHPGGAHLQRGAHFPQSASPAKCGPGRQYAAGVAGSNRGPATAWVCRLPCRSNCAWRERACSPISRNFLRSSWRPSRLSTGLAPMCVSKLGASHGCSACFERRECHQRGSLRILRTRVDSCP